jgi:hypothetical protein
VKEKNVERDSVEVVEEDETGNVGGGDNEKREG